LALEEKQRALIKYMKTERLNWELQAFHFDTRQRRYIPNGLNLTPYDPGEPPLAMPPPFAVPEFILELERRGVTRPFAQIHVELVYVELQGRPPLVLVDLEAEAPAATRQVSAPASSGTADAAAGELLVEATSESANST
jgi:hypothetical protein